MKCAECRERLYLRGKLWYSYNPKPFGNGPAYTTKCPRVHGSHVAIEEDE